MERLAGRGAGPSRPFVPAPPPPHLPGGNQQGASLFLKRMKQFTLAWNG